jgi:hypothetical protein
MSKSIYKRLTGKKRGIIGFSQLWMGPDHMLLVRSSRIAENYQRFYFSDIQSIVITSTPDRTVLQVGAVLAAIGWGALALAVASSFAKGFFLVTGVLLVALAIADLARGARCHCTLYTAVSQERLHPVSRIRIAKRFLAALQPAIESVQGSLTAEQLSEVPITSPELQVTPPRLARSNRRAAWILFGLLLLDSVLVWTGFRYSIAGGSQLLATAYSAEILLAVMVLVQGRANPLRLAYLLAAAALVCVGADIYATAPDIGRRFMLEETQSPLASSSTLHFSNRIVYFALGWRLAGGAIGFLTMLLTRPRKPAEEAAPQ